MTDRLRAAVQEALHVLETEALASDAADGAEEILRAALAQDQFRDATEMIEKPVAWRKRGGAITDDPYRASCWRDDEDAEVTPLYTLPPRREWKPLTEKEITRVRRQFDNRYAVDWSEIVRAIEAALKEKNHD